MILQLFDYGVDNIRRSHILQGTIITFCAPLLQIDKISNIYVSVCTYVELTVIQKIVEG